MSEQVLSLLDLDPGCATQALGALMGCCGFGADLFAQRSQTESWSLEDGSVKLGASSLSQGIGLRLLRGTQSLFAYADDTSGATLAASAESIRQVCASGAGHPARIRTAGVRPARPARYPQDDPTASLTAAEKVRLLELLDTLARRIDPRVVSVMATLATECDTVFIARDDRDAITDVRPLVFASLTVIVESAGVRESGSAGGGLRGSLDFLTRARLQAWASAAVAEALHNLQARKAPAGVMPVVLGPGWPGILLHEAVGHGLEADAIRRGTSAFCGRLGQQVASSCVSIADDGTIAGARGSISVDDEAEPSCRTLLIENGILRGYLQDRLSAHILGMPATGNGRRESYCCPPMPRMTNTFMLAGQHSPQEIIASVRNGIYATNFRGGQVDISSGKFVFQIARAWRIEDGRITAPIKGAMLMGNGPTALMGVRMVGNDLRLDEGIGDCSKEGQTVPVGVGCPTIRIDGLTVGGTDTDV